MPDPKERKNRECAAERASSKYYDCPFSQNPQNMYPAIRKDTDLMRDIMKTKNYVKILTQLDLNLFIMIQYYIYCDEDIWMTGEGFVFNSNPDKKILVKPMCSKSKNRCLCYDEDSPHFITICPNCNTAVDMIRDTDFTCSHCKFFLTWKKINRMPWAKLSCEWCPIEIGWHKTESISDLIKSKLKVRSTEMANKIQEDIDAFQKEMGL